MKKIIALIGICTLIFSCEESVSEDAADLQEKSGKYSLLEMDGDDISEENFTLELDAANQRLSGKTGCNNFVAAYEVDEEGGINFNPPLGTKMYCEGEMDYEETFGEILPEIVKVEISAEDLVFLSKDSKALLKLQKQEESE